MKEGTSECRDKRQDRQMNLGRLENRSWGESVNASYCRNAVATHTATEQKGEVCARTGVTGFYPLALLELLLVRVALRSVLAT